MEMLYIIVLIVIYLIMMGTTIYFTEWGGFFKNALPSDATGYRLACGLFWPVVFIPMLMYTILKKSNEKQQKEGDDNE